MNDSRSFTTVSIPIHITHDLPRIATSHVKFIYSDILTCYYLLQELLSHQSPSATSIFQRSMTSTQWQPSVHSLRCSYTITPYTIWLAHQLRIFRSSLLNFFPDFACHLTLRHNDHSLQPHSYSDQWPHHSKIHPISQLWITTKTHHIRPNSHPRWCVHIQSYSLSCSSSILSALSTFFINTFACAWKTSYLFFHTTYTYDTCMPCSSCGTPA